MSKKTRQLIIVLAIVVVIGVLVAVLALMPGDSTQNPDTSSQTSSTTSVETVYLYQHEEAEVKSLTIENENGTFVLDAYLDDDQKIEYQVSGYENLNVSSSTVSSLAAFAQKLAIIREIGSVSKLADYGLSTPVASYTAEYKDGTKVTIEIGDTLTTNTAYRYAKVKGKDTVYVVSANGMVTLKNTTLLSSSLISAATTDSDGNSVCPTFGYIRISGRDHESPIEIYPTANLTMESTNPLTMYTYYIDQIVDAPVYSSATDKYLLDMCTVSATGIEVVNPTEAECSQYGFDDPIVLRFQTVETAEDGTETKTEYCLKVGTINSDGTAYAMVDGTNVIYTMNTDTLSVLTMSAYDFRDTLLYIVSVSSVETIKMQIGSQSYVFDHERSERISSSSQASSADTSSIVYDYETYYNGELLSTFSKYYQQFLSAYKQEEYTDADQKGDLLFTVTLEHYAEFSKKQTVYKIYDCKNNDRRVIFEVDGEIIGLAKKSWATKVISDTDKVLKGEEITVTE